MALPGPRWRAEAPTGSTIRVVTLDGAPWFVAADVCRALGLGVSHTGYADVWSATRSLSSDGKVSVRRTDPRLARGTLEALFAFKVVNVALISESGLYKLILRSDKPEARAFQDWVTREVLPAIRKDGGDLPARVSHHLSCRASFTAPGHRQHSIGAPSGLQRGSAGGTAFCNRDKGQDRWGTEGEP